MEMRDGEESRKSVLIVKNLPKQVDDLSALLKTPAEQIKSFGRRRVLIHYSSKSDAESALNDLEERGFTVAKFTTLEEENGQNVWKNKATQTKKPSKKNIDNGNNSQQNTNALSGANPLDFDNAPPPYLKYAYPNINGNILNGICRALLSNKRFYTQVLHLMNRMNLEPPFSNKSDPPSLFNDASTQTTQTELLEFPTIQKSIVEAEETELETSEDERSNEKAMRPLKRKSTTCNADLYKNKARKLLEHTHKITSVRLTTNKIKSKQQMTEIFEDASKKAISKIEVKLKPNIESTAILMKPFFEPPADLCSNQMSITELEKLPIYKNYSIGDPSNKLYIKNLAKVVTSADLLALYQRFVPPGQLEIKVMQQGRMKGQAFVTFNGLSKLDTQQIVSKALQSTHGFILQLGLIETIYVDGAGPGNNNRSTKSKKLHYNQVYTYVVAVDFEATCWEKQAPPQWRESEIIEFPAVLLNLKTGKIEAEFHKYIMPMESPKLSAFCTELTGITQKTVDSGIPLQTALMMFHEWLRKELRARNLSLPKMSKDNKSGNCAFVTWTDWDFGICLAKECQRKRLKKPPFFNQWIDIRAIYREWYKHRPLNFNDALDHVGLTFEGRAHSGIDDAKNLATLTYQLVRDGATLSLTKDLTPFQLNANCIL